MKTPTQRSGPTLRSIVLIDGANLHTAARGIALEIDFARFLDVTREQSNLIRAYYFTAILEDAEYSPVRPLADWLDFNGYTVISKPAREYTDSMGRRRIKGDMDVHIAVLAMQMADYVDEVVLVSGDGDFRVLVEALQARGIRVTVVSTQGCDPPVLSDDLRRQADRFVDLESLRPLICRVPRA